MILQTKVSLRSCAVVFSIDANKMLDMFRILRDERQKHIYSCLVSDIPKRTLAQYRLNEPADIRRILSHLVLRTEGSWFLLV